MARRSGSSGRAQALAKAADAVARRDAERIAREKAVQAALAEFFHAQSETERIYAEAQKSSAPFEQIMRNAVRALDQFGETRTGVAELTGLTVARVRDFVLEDVATTGQTRPAPARQDFVAGDDDESSGESSTGTADSGHAPYRSPYR